jgi:hypothetical protein
MAIAQKGDFLANPREFEPSTDRIQNCVQIVSLERLFKESLFSLMNS